MSKTTKKINVKNLIPDTEAVNTHHLFDWIIAFARKNGVQPSPEEITKISAMKSKEVKELIKELQTEKDPC